MDSGSVLKDALVVVRRALKERGFSAKGTTFHRRTDAGNTIVLAVQKSVKSSPAEAEVTVNYGVYSARVGSRLQDDPSSAVDVMKAHWRKRLAEGGREKWLPVKATESAEKSARVLLDAIESLLPELLEHATDEALRDEWIAGSSPGIGNMHRLLFAAILVNEIGPAERVREIVDELRGVVAGGVHQGLMERQLERAGVRVA